MLQVEDHQGPNMVMANSRMSQGWKAGSDGMQTGMGFLRLLQASLFLKWKMQKYITNHLIGDEDKRRL